MYSSLQCITFFCHTGIFRTALLIRFFPNSRYRQVTVEINKSRQPSKYIPPPFVSRALCNSATRKHYNFFRLFSDPILPRGATSSLRTELLYLICITTIQTMNKLQPTMKYLKATCIALFKDQLTNVRTLRHYLTLLKYIRRSL
jgi:hypothetical protein